jgi:hypothetical protein
MATRILSPKQILERARLHRQAVMTFARLAAKRAVQDQLRAQARAVQGLKREACGSDVSSS